MSDAEPKCMAVDMDRLLVSWVDGLLAAACLDGRGISLRYFLPADELDVSVVCGAALGVYWLLLYIVIFSGRVYSAVRSLRIALGVLADNKRDESS